jgi:hypothetical protein
MIVIFVYTDGQNPKQINTDAVEHMERETITENF